MLSRLNASTRRADPRGRRRPSVGALLGVILVLGLTACSAEPNAVLAPDAPGATPVSSAPSSAAPSSAATSPAPGTRTPTSPTPTAPTPTAKASSAPQTAEIPATLRFSGTTVDDRPFDGASLAGKPTLLWFWAPWCPTCRSQIPQVQEIASAHGADANVIGVGSLDGGPAIKTFADSAPGITHLTDESGAIWRHFAVQQQSSFVLLDATGAVVLTAGYGGSDAIGQRVDELVRP